MQAAVKERVLVVDDEPQVLVALEDLLGDKFTVFKTGSAVDALEVMKRERDIAVIITDQRMPNMNGDELLAKLGPSSDAQRIMLTGFADLSAVIRAVNDGKLFSYVTKPWSAEDLQLKVQSAVEHFRLAKELAEERQLLRDLMDNIPDAIYFKGADRRFRRVNRSFLAMTGASNPEAWVGRRLDEVEPEAAAAYSAESDDGSVLSDGRAITDAVREYSVNGERRWVSETKAPIRARDGRVVGLVGVTRDVTERVMAEEAQRQSEERYRNQSRVLNSILDGMGDGVIAVGREQELLLFNRRARQILGAALPDAPQAQWTQAYDVRHSDDKTRISREEDPLSRVMSGADVPDLEIIVNNGAAGGATVSVTATALRDDAGNLAGGIALLRDVTRQRSLERQLTQAQKMEAVGRLAGGIAHDFNNLLSVIHCYGEMLLDVFEEGNPARADLRELLAAAERASALTRQLLAFSRRKVVQTRILQLNDVVSDVENMLCRLIGEDIEFVTRLSPDLAMVKADPGQVEQIVLNLAVNARDAMPSGGRLMIETQNVSLSQEYLSSHARVAPGEFVVLAVTDTGTGMDAETQARIFEPFFTTKEVGKGTGLGLSTVYGIVEQSGGHVWVYSEVGHGTTFKIYLPQVDGEGASRSLRKQGTSLASGTGVILLVEDDEAVRRVAARILHDCGYTVLEARRPSDARRICLEMGPRINLLLTDVVMPEISGLKLAEELLGAHTQMRVLYMSGYPGAAVVHDGLLEPAAPYIEKPFSPLVLSERVREVLTASS
jgi:PAS domain S-box-containing protein